MELRELPQFMKAQIKQAGGILPYSKLVDLPRQTVYNLINGGTPTPKVAEKIGLEIKLDALHEAK